MLTEDTTTAMSHTRSGQGKRATAETESTRQIIAALGGPTRVGEICNVNRSQVWRWTVERDKRGTGGKIPRRHWATLLRYARDNGIALPTALFVPELAE